MSKTITLLDDEWDQIFRLVSYACEDAAKEMHFGQQANYGMGQGTVQEQQRKRYELLVRCVAAVGEPK